MSLTNPYRMTTQDKLNILRINRIEEAGGNTAFCVDIEDEEFKIAESLRRDGVLKLVRSNRLQTQRKTFEYNLYTL